MHKGGRGTVRQGSRSFCMGAHYDRARLLFKQRRYAMAERELREELAETPQSGWAHGLLGRCLAEQKRLLEAVEANEEGVRLAPAVPYVHYVLGLTYKECGRLKEAEGALREALRLEPRNPDYLLSLSWVQYLRDDLRGALISLKQGLAIDPDHVGCHNARGQLQRLLGNWRKAEATLRESLRLDPENDFTHTQLACALWTRAHARAGVLPWWPWRPEMSEALQHCREALRLNPDSAFARESTTGILNARHDVFLKPIAILTVICVFVAFLLFLKSLDGSPRNPAPPDDGVVKGALLFFSGILTLSVSEGLHFLLLRCSRLGAAILSPAQQRAATVTARCLIAAAVAGAVALLTPPPFACAVLFLSLALSGPVSIACSTTPGWPQWLMAAYAALLASAGLACVVCIQGSVIEARVAAVLLIGVVSGSLFSVWVGRGVAWLFMKKAG